MPSEAENNLNAAELKIPCLAQVCSSSTAERMLSTDRGIRSPVSPGLAVLPACLGPVPWCSVSSCQGPRLPVRAGTASPVVKSTSPSGLSLTVPGERAFHHWKVCTDTANKSHRTRSGCVLHGMEVRRDTINFPSFLVWGPQWDLRCILSLDLSFIPMFWLHFDEVTILCLITCAARELEGDDNLQLNLWTRVHHDYRHAKISPAASVIINKVSNAFI